MFQYIRKHRILCFFIFAIALAYATFCGFALYVEDYGMFPVPKPNYQKTLPDLINIGTKEEPIYALWLKNPNATQSIIFFHGNAEDIGDIQLFVSQVRKQGYSILAVDYEGYGLSYGTPSEKGCYRTANAAYKFLTEIENISPENIISFGFSIGTGSAVYLAAHEPIGGLILQSPFLSAYRVITKIKLLPFDAFDNLAKIKKVNCPLLVLHGTKDSVIPFEQGRKLFEAANFFSQNKFISVEGADHHNLNYYMAQHYFEAIKSFTDSLFPKITENNK